MEETRPKHPYWVYIRLAAYVWTGITVAFAVFLWAFWEATLPDHPTWATGWFLAYVIVSMVMMVIPVSFHSHVMTYYPMSRKLRVGKSPAYPAGDWIPGATVRTLQLPLDRRPDGPVKDSRVELHLCGIVDGAWRGLTPARGPLLVGRVPEGAKSAFDLEGVDGFCDARAEPFILGDLHHWRGYDWRRLFREMYGEKLSPFTRVVFGLDRRDPQSGAEPADIPFLEQESFILRRRVSQLEAQRADQTETDKEHRESETEEL